MSVECALGCGQPVNPYDASTWKKVTGFVGGPKKDSMRLREDTGEYAHDHCVAKVLEGQPANQVSMFDDGLEEQVQAVNEDLPDILKE